MCARHQLKFARLQNRELGGDAVRKIRVLLELVAVHHDHVIDEMRMLPVIGLESEDGNQRVLLETDVRLHHDKNAGGLRSKARRIVGSSVLLDEHGIPYVGGDPRLSKQSVDGSCVFGVNVIVRRDPDLVDLASDVMTKVDGRIKGDRFDVDVENVPHVELRHLGSHGAEEATNARVATHPHLKIGRDAKGSGDVLLEIRDAKPRNDRGILVVLEIVHHQNGLVAEDFHHLVENVNVLKQTVGPDVVVADLDGREEDTWLFGSKEKGHRRRNDGLRDEPRSGADRWERSGH